MTTTLQGRIVAAVMALILTGCSSTPPADLGINDGKLAPCPSSPNCVSSFATEPDQAIPPLNSDLKTIERIVKTLDGAEIVEASPGYLRVEFTSAIFRFVDDVEFVQMGDADIVHLRSASRLGYSDLGVNRKRIEELRERLKQ